MAEHIARMATTGVVSQGGTRIEITRKAIDSLVNSADEGRALPFVVEHDPSCMPIGKITELWAEPFEREYAAMGRVHIEEGARAVTHMKSGASLVCLGFVEAPKPFVRKSRDGKGDLLAIGVDRANFQDAQSHAAFVDAVVRIDEEIACRGIARHSLVPEPLIEFVLSNIHIKMAVALGLWTIRRVEKFVRYTVDETLKKTADSIAAVLSEKMKRIVKAYSQRKTKDQRPILVEIAIPGDLDLILLARVDGRAEFPGIDLKNLTAEMEKYGDLLQQAEEVTFLRTDTSWKFQYLKTRTGEVLGSQECYSRTLKRLRSAGSTRS